MKVLLLALVLGLVYGELPELTPEQVDGDWRTLYTGADNVEKTSEGGPLRAYYRHMECTPSCENVTLSFYIKFGENCTLITIVGQRTPEGSYSIYAEETGLSTFQVLPLTEKLMSVYNVNVDPEEKTTHMITLIGKDTTVTEEQLQEFYQLAEKHGIAKENIQDAVPTDTCEP
ncbi:female-specific lacrimal gland protein-like [Nannospalax galili]|uniref:female-specific lacrimal gland protein-like n=1 Tax=Nannospalax galili TaxID=1026970 RepID=UPI000819F9D4|nr:female-specific lacrimal gland protein-like [Nannospalax galili]